MSQNFVTTDVLRLEIEEDAAGLVNLVQNPSGELGGWAWVTPVANSALLSSDGYLRYEGTSTGADAENFYTEAMPVTAGQYAAASWYVGGGSTGDYYQAKFEWLNSSGSVIGTSTQTGYLSVGTVGTSYYGPHLAPVSTAYVRLRFDLYDNNSGTNPGASNYFTVKEVTVAKAATSGALGTLRTNLVTNPSLETNTTGWQGYSNCTIARSTAQAHTGSASLAVTATSTSPIAATLSGASGFPVVGNETYTLQFQTRAATVGRTVYGWFAWYDSTGTYISTSTVGFAANSSGSWTQITATKVAPSNAAYAMLRFQFVSALAGEVHYLDAVMVEAAPSADTYFDGSTAAAGGWTYGWSGTAHNSASTATTSNLAYIEPISYLNILGPTHDIKVVREVMNIGTLSATILDATLDPSQSDLIRPGRRVRLLAFDFDGLGDWVPLFTGKVTEASVTYDLKDPAIPETKRARVVLNAVDATADLANQKRAEGVATVDELPYVLEGCGVPWSCNYSGNQVPSATVVAVNENASALDQVAITRDTNFAGAWLDKYGVLWVDDQYGLSLVEAMYSWVDEYSDLDVSYNTKDCINEVNLKFLRYNPSTGETEEIPYGPYRDETSIEEWGVRSATFTIQGIAEETADLLAYANAILALNANPVVTVNSMTVPVTENWKVSYYGCLADLRGRVNIEKPHGPEVDPGDGDYYDLLLIQSIEHTITPEKWIAKFGFSDSNTVASPQFTPSPNTGAGGQTIGQLLRPIGEITMYGGASIPAGWLKCDGSTFSSLTYPDLATLLGDTFGAHSGTTYYLPNFTDRFPIGAGTKALGTSGGNASQTIGANNLPTHTHPAGTLANANESAHTHGMTAVAVPSTSSATGTSTANIARGNATNTGNISPLTGSSGAGSAHTHTISGSTGNNTTTATALDILNPWLAVNFIIRAV